MIQWFPAKLIDHVESERLRRDLIATIKYFKVGHTLQASDIRNS